MPLGAFRINSLARAAAAPSAETFEALNSLTGIDGAADSIYYHYTTAFVGETSGGDPIFVWTYRDASDLNFKVVAFSVDSTDGSLTIGTPSSTGRVTKVQGNYVVTEASGAGVRSTPNGYGYVTYCDNTSGDPYVSAFSVNTSTLAVTLGSEVQRTNAESAATSHMAYVGNSAVVIFFRGASNRRDYEIFTRSGTTLTSALAVNDTGINDGGFPQDGVGFEYHTGNASYRWVDTHAANNFDGVHYAAHKTYSGALYGDIELDDFTTTETNSTSFAVNLNSSDRAAIIRYDTGDNNIQAKAIDISWGANSTAPTITKGSALTLSGTDYSPIGFGPGIADDEFYYFKDDAGSLKYHRITASGTTLTEETAVDTGLSTTSSTGTYKFDVAITSGGGKFLVGVVDNSGSNIPDVVALRLE